MEHPTLCWQLVAWSCLELVDVRRERNDLWSINNWQMETGLPFTCLEICKEIWWAPWSGKVIGWARLIYYVIYVIFWNSGCIASRHMGIWERPVWAQITDGPGYCSSTPVRSQQSRYVCFAFDWKLACITFVFFREKLPHRDEAMLQLARNLIAQQLSTTDAFDQIDHMWHICKKYIRWIWLNTCQVLSRSKIIPSLIFALCKRTAAIRNMTRVTLLIKKQNSGRWKSTSGYVSPGVWVMQWKLRRSKVPKCKTLKRLHFLSEIIQTFFKWCHCSAQKL